VNAGDENLFHGTEADHKGVAVFKVAICDLAKAKRLVCLCRVCFISLPLAGTINSLRF
jgi:hypothetical protein